MGPAESDWLLQLGVLPAQATALLAEPTAAALHCSLAAGSGQGQAWADAGHVAAHQVEQLRRRCRALGGDLSVLRQPQGSAPLPAWLDSPARPQIEALKRQFDPLQQLARGRLPGVQA